MLKKYSNKVPIFFHRCPIEKYRFQGVGIKFAFVFSMLVETSERIFGVMKSVFITGVAGFLGSHLAKRMHELGWSVSGNDNFLGADKENIHSFVNFYEADCCDLTAMSKAIDGTDLLFHCAATAHEGLSVFSPTFITKNNYEETITNVNVTFRFYFL